jgi:lipopolysaccharide/colanic/teichoic acid biosynthesis glycosyltransferase
VSFGERLIKRSFDLFISGVLLFLLSPVLLIVAFSVRMVDGKPVIFKQERVGKGGRPFTIYKFRTMRHRRDAGSTVTATGDARITSLGAFLRKFKLDELPQLWNVLRGDMSLVGPRPDVREYMEGLSKEDLLILSVRPGVTGPATIKYRHEEDLLALQKDPEEYNRKYIFPDKVSLNREYVSHYSFWKDLKYLIMTLRTK